MSTVKVVAVFSIIFGCFAMLYPRFLHPIVLKSFGMTAKSAESDILANMPPPRAAVNVDRARPSEDTRQMRPGHHPGLRAASEMRAQQQQAGGGRGMMGIVLPMYAVGIVLYLVYTLVKVFSKRSEPVEKDPVKEDPLAQLRNFKYDDRKGKFTFGEDFDPDDDFRDYLRKKQKQQELEELISKADDRHNIDTKGGLYGEADNENSRAEIEMRQLQQRLEETESQMTRILQAMQSVQQHVSGVVDRASGNTTNNPEDAAQKPSYEKEEPDVYEEKYPETTPESENKPSEKCEKYEKTNVAPSDSNPDLESYEVLATNSNGGSEESSDYSLLNENGGASRNSPEVENVSSVTNVGTKLAETPQSEVKEAEVSEKSDNPPSCTKFEEDYENDYNTNQTDCDEATSHGSGVTVEDIGAEDESTVDDSVILRKRSVKTSSKD